MASNIAIAWTNLTASVRPSLLARNESIILDNISGCFEFNKINALMGSSGSGKTTLLKCLNASNEYTLSGDSNVLINSEDRITKCFIYQNHDKRCMSGLTVRQALSYASKLKNSEECCVNHNEIITRVMSELLISDIGDNLIEKCSGGEVKRICMALELTAVKRPNIMFLDEPTTGLDSNAAEVLIDCLKRLCRSHKMSIIASIHQPNQDLFLMFDSVYVLAKGGGCIYSGPPQQLRQYLNDSNIECNETQIPIEVLIELSFKSISDKNVKQLTNKFNSIEFDTKELAQSSSNNYKSFKLIDFWYILIRFLHRNYVSQYMNQLKTLTMFTCMVMFMINCISKRVSYIDGCVEVNKTSRSTCQVQFEEDTILYQNQWLLFMPGGIFTLILLTLHINSFTDDFRFYKSEHRNNWYSSGAYWFAKYIVDTLNMLIFTLITIAVIQLCREQVQDAYKLGLYFYIIAMTYVITKSFGSMCGTLCASSPRIAVLLGVIILSIYSFNNNFLFRAKKQFDLQYFNEINYHAYAINSALILVYGLGRCPAGQESKVLIDYDLQDDQALFWKYILYFAIFYIYMTMVEMTLFIMKEKLSKIKFSFVKSKEPRTLKCYDNAIEMESYQYKIKPVEVRNDQDNKLPREMMISWLDLTYEVERNSLSSVILDNITGSFDKCTLNAIMGPSGAGKTTLMKCLNGRLTSGLSRNSKIFVSNTNFRTCFVVQNTSEHLIQGLTVRQTLTYASKLKNSRIVNELDHKKIVANLMSEVLITDTADNSVESCCSGGEQKRTVIAAELTSHIKPKILFIDEPTSGLDSTAADVLVKCLKKLCLTHNITVISSIHQPNQQLFHMFDQIYVLAKGGVCVYSGPPKHIRQHLNDGQINCDQNQVPIEVLLKVCSEEKKSEPINRLLYKNNNLYENCLKQNMCEMNDSKNIAKRLSFADIRLLLRRTIDFWYRYQWKLYFFYFLQVLVGALGLWYRFNHQMIEPDGCLDPRFANSCKNTFEQINQAYLIRENMKFICFALTTIAILQVIFTSLTFGAEYNIFKHEQRNGWYSTGSFFIANSLLELLPTLISGAIFCMIIDLYKGYEIFIVFYVMNVFILLCTQSIAQMAAIISPRNTNIAILMAILCEWFLIVIGNLIMPVRELHYSLQVASSISFVKYASECVYLIIYGFSRCKKHQFSTVLMAFDIKTADFWPNVIKIIFITLFYRCLTLIVLIIKTNNIRAIKTNIFVKDKQVNISGKISKNNHISKL